jgi:hypothetical protein
MRRIALVLNVGVLIALGYFTFVEGINDPNTTSILVLILMAGAALSAIVALWGPLPYGWLALYFKRKAIEEQNRIDELEKKS